MQRSHQRLQSCALEVIGHHIHAYTIIEVQTIEDSDSVLVTSGNNGGWVPTSIIAFYTGKGAGRWKHENDNKNSGKRLCSPCLMHRCSHLDLDLSLNCQAPCGYHGNEVCAHYGRVFGASWFLKEGTEAAEVMVSFKVFHWTTVLGANDSWYAVWRQRIVLSLLAVTLPLTGLVL